jgi:hypothetical protein
MILIIRLQGLSTGMHPSGVIQRQFMYLEHILTSAQDSTTTLKFDGRLEPIVGSSTEIGKEDFVDLLKEKVREFGQETFYYVKNTSNLTFELFENAHYFRLETLITKFFNQLTGVPDDFKTFDQLEIDEIVL